MKNLLLVAGFILSTLTLIGILVWERLMNPPRNGHYQDIEDKLENKP